MEKRQIHWIALGLTITAAIVAAIITIAAKADAYASA